MVGPQHTNIPEIVGMLWYNKNMAGQKSAKQMERHLKGMANHHRIEILLLIAEKEGITLDKIVEELQASQKTIGEHTRRLVQAGLVDKKYRGRFVEHKLSPYGRFFANFLKSFRNVK